MVKCHSHPCSASYAEKRGRTHSFGAAEFNAQLCQMNVFFVFSQHIRLNKGRDGI